MIVRKRFNETDKLVADRIKNRRIMLGMNQSELGKAIGVSIQQFQKYEKGTNRISAGKLFTLAKALKVSIEYFFKDNPEINAVVEENLDNNGIRRLLKEFNKITEAKKREKLIEFLQVMAKPN